MKTLCSTSRHLQCLVRLFFICVLTTIQLPAQAQTPGSNDPSFNPEDIGLRTGFDGAVFDIVLTSDNKLLTGGDFVAYNGKPVKVLARLSQDGTLDESFQANISGENAFINSIAIQPDGKIIIGGKWMTINGKANQTFARLLPDGSVDNSFQTGTGFNGQVQKVALQSDGKIVVGGLFNSYNGKLSQKIVRLNTDGSLDTSFEVGFGFNNSVNALTIRNDGKIIVAGGFSAYMTQRTNRIACLNPDGSQDIDFNNNIGTGFDNSQVKDVLALPDGKILVAGNIFMFNGMPVRSIIRLHKDGRLDESFLILQVMIKKVSSQ